MTVELSRTVFRGGRYVCLRRIGAGPPGGMEHPTKEKGPQDPLPLNIF